MRSARAQVSKLLQFNPDKRITAEQALEHPYVAQFHNKDDEPVHNGAITIPIDDNHKARCSGRLVFPHRTVAL